MTRTDAGELLYFCLLHCADQFDREHVASATTGVREGNSMRWIDLPLTQLGNHQGADHLVEKIEALSGVSYATVNPKLKLLRVQYHPHVVGVADVVKSARAAGYSIGSAKSQLGIEGMCCRSCVLILEEALRHTPGVVSASVNLAMEQAQVEYIAKAIDAGGLARAIEAIGYRVYLPDGHTTAWQAHR